MIMYNPSNHYWVIGGDESRAWSSAARSYVSEWPRDAETRIANEYELREVLAKANVPKLAPGYVPASVYMWQAKVALAAIGKLETADTAIDASNNPALILAWYTAPEISRASPAVEAIGQVLGLSAKDIDNLFIQAESFKV